MVPPPPSGSPSPPTDSWPLDEAPASPPASVRWDAPHYAASSDPPPDVVLLRDGGMLRGTIVRSRPGESVRVELATGDTEEIPWSDVRFAGPASQAPLAAPQPSERASARDEHAGEVRVRFHSEQRLTLHHIGGTATSTVSVPGTWVQAHGRADYYERIGTAPCDLWLVPGEYHFGLSIGDHGPFQTRAIDITGPGVLEGRYVDHGALRAVGWVIFLLSLAGGAVGVTFGILGNGYSLDWVALLAGGSTALVGMLIGLPMMAAGNGVVLRFE